LFGETVGEGFLKKDINPASSASASWLRGSDGEKAFWGGLIRGNEGSSFNGLLTGWLKTGISPGKNWFYYKGEHSHVQ